jgi:hypothetical protein
VARKRIGKTTKAATIVTDGICCACNGPFRVDCASAPKEHQQIRTPIEPDVNDGSDVVVAISVEILNEVDAFVERLVR